MMNKIETLKRTYQEKIKQSPASEKFWQTKIFALAELEEILEKEEKPFSIVQWTAEDIRNEIEKTNPEYTEEDISNIIDSLDMESYEEHCISYGWEQYICPAIKEYTSKD